MNRLGTLRCAHYDTDDQTCHRGSLFTYDRKQQLQFTIIAILMRVHSTLAAALWPPSYTILHQLSLIPLCIAIHVQYVYCSIVLEYSAAACANGQHAVRRVRCAACDGVVCLFAELVCRQLCESLCMWACAKNLCACWCSLCRAFRG